MSTPYPADLLRDVQRRRTFAIISHPDAGKTTLTEKLLLFGGAIQMAGTVKARKSARHAISDWMEVEKQRGISVTRSVMRFEYAGHVINLLDTPGHQDFSEDTYRVLTAVDAAVMVIDAAQGVEAQTIKLLEVCRLRNTPIITFVNKMEREVRAPVELIEGLANPRLDERFPMEIGPLREDVELIRAASHPFDITAFLAGTQSPAFFGSGINNFGVREILQALVEWAPPPQPRDAGTRMVQPAESAFRACSRSRPTWTPGTATASPSSASARGATRQA